MKLSVTELMTRKKLKKKIESLIKLGHTSDKFLINILLHKSYDQVSLKCSDYFTILIIYHSSLPFSDSLIFTVNHHDFHDDFFEIRQ